MNVVKFKILLLFLLSCGLGLCCFLYIVWIHSNLLGGEKFGVICSLKNLVNNEPQVNKDENLKI